jgi:6,7-dimethyl-8-ribityllumazine synthase
MKKKVLIVIANYYPNISSSLSTDAQVTLDFAKIQYSIKEVLGVFEIPVVIAKNIKKYDGFIALGCVIKGETPHFDYISKTTFDGLMKLSIENKKPIGNGIITALNKKQAYARMGNINRPKRLSKKKGKGEESAKAVIAVLFK